MNTWENNDAIQQFYNNSECPVAIMAEAYYIRDVQGLNITFPTIQKQTLHKLFSLNHTLKQRMIDNVMQNVKNNLVNFETEQDKYTLNLEIDFSEIKSKYEKNMIRHDELKQITDHQDFYKALTREELTYIGW